jgi:NAD(P)-dependent dehydrogenase (short-subunit alcohol dehydrogenase family)
MGEGLQAYSQSKLALIMFTLHLAEELQGTGVTANVLHPASLMDTKMVFESFGYNLSSVHDGAAATIRLVIDPKLEGVSGRYYDQLREARAHSQAYDRDARARLRALSEDLTGLTSATT